MQVFRSRILLGDPHSYWSPAWDVNGNPAGYGPGELLAPDGTVFLLHPVEVFDSDPCYWFAHGYQPDGGVPPGVYQSRFGSELGPDVELVKSAPPPTRKRQYTYVGPGRDDTVDTINLSLKHGKPVWLGAGRHYLDEEINTYGCVNPWIDGVGATLERLPDASYGTRMFFGCQDLTLRGLELRPWFLVGHANPPTTNWRMIDVRVVGNGGPQTTGWGQSDVHFERCQFDGVFTPQAGFYLRNRYRGPRGGPAFTTPIRPGGIVFIDNDVDGCPRGVVVNTNGGPVVDCLFAGTRVHGIHTDSNGNEARLVEGSGDYNRNLHVHDRIWDCDGPAVSLWSAPCADDKFVDLVQEGGLGIWLCDADDKGQVRIVFDTWELRRSLGVTLGWTDGNGAAHGTNVRDNAFRNGSIVGWGPSALTNQSNYASERLGRKYVLQADPRIPGWGVNKVENVRFKDLPVNVDPWELVLDKNDPGKHGFVNPPGIDLSTVQSD